MLKPYDSDSQDGVTCPETRPVHFGLHIAIRQIVRGLAGDLWRVQIAGDIELTISLIDCFAPPLVKSLDANADVQQLNAAGVECYDRAWDVLEKARSQLTAFIPVPLVDRGWLRSLNADSILPGWIYLSKSVTLNKWLVTKKLASPVPIVAPGQ